MTTVDTELPPATGAWREGDDPGRRQWITPAGAAPAGGRRRAARGPDRLRDVGRAERGRVQRRAGAARPHRRQPRRRPGRTRPPHPGLVGRAGRAGPRARPRTAGSWWRRTSSAAARAAPARPRPPRTAGRGAAASRSSPRGTRSPPRRCSPTRSASTRWACVIGGSMGGMRAWSGRPPSPTGWRGCSCWPARPRRRPTRSAGPRRSSPRSATTPGWRGGDYHDAPPGHGPHRGLGVARRIAHLSYRSAFELGERFGRRAQDGEDPWHGGRYAVESYLDHHAREAGAPLRRRAPTCGSPS